MSQKSYIVMGSTGSHEDYTEWPIVTYSIREAADEHVAKARAWAEERGLTEQSFGRSLLSHDENPWDPSMRVDYTGVHYSVIAVPARISRVAPLKRGRR